MKVLVQMYGQEIFLWQEVQTPYLKSMKAPSLTCITESMNSCTLKCMWKKDLFKVILHRVVQWSGNGITVHHTIIISPYHTINDTIIQSMSECQNVFLSETLTYILTVCTNHSFFTQA